MKRDDQEGEKSMDDDLLTLEEVSHYLKVNKATVYRMAQAGRIPALKVGKVWRFQKSKINEWLAMHSNEARVAVQAEVLPVGSQATGRLP